MTANRIANDIRMRRNQLNFMCDQLEEVYDDNDAILFKLKNIKELIIAGNIYMGSSTLQKIIFDPELLEKNEKAHRIILENTRKEAFKNIMSQGAFEILSKYILKET
jgi:hypothetical protein